MLVEIKKNSHSDLWSALRSQLIEQYTNRTPKTDTYEIYLVFWFGELDGHHTESPSFGKHPVDAPELKEQPKEEANRHRKKPVKSRSVSSTKAGRHEQREKLLMDFVCI